MTEKEYQAACDSIVRQYCQQEERMIADRKRSGTFGKDPEGDHSLFLRLNLEMRRKLRNLEKQYIAQPVRPSIYGGRSAMTTSGKGSAAHPAVMTATGGNDMRREEVRR